MKYTFENEDQQQFSLLSGDYNPMHINAQYARRTMFGSQVVHGVNLLLSGLNYWCINNSLDFHLMNLKVAFRKGLTIGQQITYSINQSNKLVRIEGHNQGNLIIKIDFEWGEKTNNCSFAEINPASSKASDLDTKDFHQYSNTEEIILNPGLFRELYPKLAKHAEFDQLAILLTSTRIVGMRCPGKRSVYSSLEIKYFEQELKDKVLRYKVLSFDKRFNLLKIEGETNSASLKILAFHRPKHFQQDGVEKVQSLVTKDEFKGVKALIVGGSRGIGAISAKILAAGGADVTVSYNNGKTETEELVNEMNEFGITLKFLKLNILDGYSESLANLLRSEAYTHLFYYATPFIFSGSKKIFSVELYEKFNQFYVNSFYQLFSMVFTDNLGSVVYPSTVALDEKPLEMKEYVLAKTAGEELCTFLSRLYKDILFYVPRLPRLATDQTMSLTHVKNQDPLPEMLKHIRASITKM